MALKAAEILATALEQDADAYEKGELHDLHARIEKVRREVSAINDIPRPIYKLALRFWKSWADSSHHSWRYQDFISENDWPELSRIIAQHVRKGTLPNDKRILDNFMRKRRMQPFKVIKELFK